MAIEQNLDGPQTSEAEEHLPIVLAAAAQFGMTATVDPNPPALNFNVGYILNAFDGSTRRLEVDSYLVGTYLSDKKVSFQHKADFLTEKLWHGLRTSAYTLVIS